MTGGENLFDREEEEHPNIPICQTWEESFELHLKRINGILLCKTK